jgi:FkbM family methyltransferase
MLKRIINAIGWRLKTRKPREYTVGKFAITLPAGHKLDMYQRNYKNYDRKLPIIASLTESKYGKMSIIDIGANIGDTAAALRGVCESPIVCVEGNLNFLPFLEANTSRLPGTFRIIPKYIGLDLRNEIWNVVTANGTSHLQKKEVKTSPDFVRVDNFSLATYNEIVKINSDLPEVRLVKIDTDGFDFKIIQASLHDLCEQKPIIFFEFDPSFSLAKERREAAETLNSLYQIGYVNYIIFDNFGNYLMSFCGSHPELFSDLMCYLEQSVKNGGGINYFDICCLSENDKDIFGIFVQKERNSKVD